MVPMHARTQRNIYLLLFWGALVVSGVQIVRLGFDASGSSATIVLIVVLAVCWVLALTAGLMVIRSRRRRAIEKTAAAEPRADH